jgi:FdhE protein
MARADLDRLMAARPELESPGRALGRVLEATFSGPPALSLPPIDPGLIDDCPVVNGVRAGWREGISALARIEPALDRAAIIARARSIARAVAGGGSPPAALITKSLERAPAQALDWVGLALTGDDEGLDASARSAGLDAAAVASLTRLIVLPGLAGWSRSAYVLLEEGAWPHGNCPICAAEPALAESRGLEQRRRLRCDRCAADWPGNCLRCPFCDTADHRDLRYVFVDGEKDRHRLAICDRCGGRIKVVATLSPLSPPALLVAELASVHLDLVAEC